MIISRSLLDCWQKRRSARARLLTIRYSLLLPYTLVTKAFIGPISERDKVLRALKNKEENQVIDGFRIYYNFIRPHQALNGKTPAEMANLNLNLGQNKWLSLIKQSVEDKKIPKATLRKLLTLKSR
jgi:hypothetical protein